jgi:protein-tyrosine phosphatase
MARPRGHDWLPDDIRRLRRAGVEVIASASPEVEELGLEGEAEECAQSGLRFVSFPMADRSAPTSPISFTALVDRLAEYSKNGKAIAIHCRVGIGRSSMIAAGVLIMNGLSPDSAFQTIEEARGCPVPDTHEQRQRVELWASDLGRTARHYSENSCHRPQYTCSTLYLSKILSAVSKTSPSSRACAINIRSNGSR